MPDTNIIFSALLFKESLPANILFYITEYHELILCDYIIAELQDVVARKRPDLLPDIDVLLAQLSYELISAPREPSKLISDPKDHPILNAAILADVDIIISGDKHFLNINLEHPQTMSAASFWQLEHSNLN
ncbi:MAG: PIN domain-containing protein [Candidatus Margulisbacteria bacterium]|jgi:predicted nucleic acid-binding protein|nr:PIN domain-containing protein [Candidatus Margulisiibacteriota bacterium]